MPILEDMVATFKDVSEQLACIHKEIASIEVQQEDDILWTKDDLKKYMQFKSYLQIKAVTENKGFPKVMIGNTERYPKKLVIEYFNNLANSRETHSQELVFKGNKSALYQN